MAVSREAMEQAVAIYYKMMSWDARTEILARDKPQELGIGWVASELGKVR